MINKVILMGRITHDLEVKQTPSGIACLTFTLAVERNYSKGKEKQTDFITCVAWRNTAEFINRYFGKGRMIAIEGNIRTGSYDDGNGARHYTTDVYVDSVSFTGEKASDSGQSSNTSNYTANNGNPQRASQTAKNEVGDLADFEEVLSDDGVPF